MRKSVFFSIALSVSVLCSGAFGASNQNQRGRTQNNTTTASAATNSSVARAATRGATKKATVQTARAGKTQSVKNNVVSARAGSTQKVINTGTKVASATANTNVPQECQDAFYGCMDAFCMLDNASGGRCQCNDRIIELDKALEDILKLDEQTYLMATEGVERIQMGEAEDQIMARAKAAAEKTVSKEKEDNKKKARTLDLSAWNNTIFNDVEDLFESSSGDSLETFADKKGDDLYKASAKMCAAQVPDTCQSYGSMMQLIYAQKIKSDCVAYENSLKAQRSQSQQKLQAAQKALREAALEEYQNQNKYATTGECVIAFTRCMQTTAECGEDYTGCVTLAAKENVKGTKSGKAAKQTTIKSSVAGADITLAATTMDQLLAKKLICESVTKQCVNANRNDAVWKAFLRNAAPALKSAEDIAEQRLRMECIPSVAKCFQEACKSNFGEGDSYDMCLSNPETYKSLCKVQLEPCLEATGGTYEEPKKSTLWNGLVAMLNSMKVDACTKEVKDCLLSEDRCGADYAGCIGLDTNIIMNMCPADKLTACMEADVDGVKLKNAEAIGEYVAQIAQGLALNIDNKMLLTCQSALDTAMINVCGDANSCPKAVISANSITDLLGVEICLENTTTCHADPYAFEKSDILAGRVGVQITNRPSLSSIYVKNDLTLSEDLFGFNENSNDALISPVNNALLASLKPTNDTPTKTIKDALNAAWNSKIAQIETDPKVQYCIKGRTVQAYSGRGTSGNNNNNNTNTSYNLESSPRFKNLTQTAKLTIANSLMDHLWEDYEAAIEKLNKEQVPVLAQKLTDVIADAVANEEAKVDFKNGVICRAKALFSQEQPDINGCDDEYTTRSAEYDNDTNICKVTITDYRRYWYGDKSRGSCSCGGLCQFVAESTQENLVPMSTYSRFDAGQRDSENSELQQKLRLR